MNEGLFRKKSTDRVSSPEELDNYMKVVNPSIWIVLGAIILIIVGLCIWGIFGKLTTTIEVGGNCNGKELICFVGEDDIERITEDMTVRIDGQSFQIKEIAEKPVHIKEVEDYALYLSHIDENDWAFSIICDCDKKPGTYQCEIIMDSFSPIRFVLN